MSIVSMIKILLFLMKLEVVL